MFFNFFSKEIFLNKKRIRYFFYHVEAVSIDNQCLWEIEALYMHHLAWSIPGAHELAYILYGTSQDQWNQASKVTNHRVRIGTRSYHMLESSHTTIPDCLCPVHIWSWNLIPHCDSIKKWHLDWWHGSAGKGTWGQVWRSETAFLQKTSWKYKYGVKPVARLE